MEFTAEEQRIISPFFTNIDRPVFALRNLPEVVKGALFSRYSRSDKSLRRLLLDEFINQPEMGFKEIVRFQADQGEDEVIAVKKAEEFYDRVLVGFGDDSVAELGGAHIACEDVSNIASKVLEEPRIGMSPLEKSTRYVFFNEKINGQYRYYKDPIIMGSEFSDLYIEFLNSLFDTYSDLIDPIKKYVTELNPINASISERAYAFTIRAKACDILRVLLPAATLTNVGIFGNGRAFEYLLMKMYAHELSEIRALAQSMHNELNGIIPSFVKRSNDQYGQANQKFLIETRNAINSVVNVPASKELQSNSVTLIDYDAEEDAEIKIVTAILYSHSSRSMSAIREFVKAMSVEERRKIITEYVNRRANRRQRPGRAFENTSYTFDLVGNYGIYRDIQRHRMLTQEKQELTVNNGYDIPKELVETGFADRYHALMNQAIDVFNEVSKHYPKQAQYVVPFGFHMRWYFTMNLREAFHILELRTSQQGHPDYRKLCQNMFLSIKNIHPFLGGFMSFVDMNEYGLERLEAEKKRDQKMEQLKIKYGESQNK